MIRWLHLYVYKCSLCELTATCPVKAQGHYRCARCARWLAFLYVMPIETEEEQAQAQAGLVYLPFRRAPVPRPTCDLCPMFVGHYGVTLPDGARFCWRHAEEGIRRYEAQEPPPANLMAEGAK